MGIAISVQHYLQDHHIPFDVETHDHTWCSYATARAGAIPAGKIAKGVLLRRSPGLMLWRSPGYLLAIVPASARVRLDEVRRLLGEPVTLASEAELAALFTDCEPGSVPPIGEAYGLKALLDEELEGLVDVYFEGGDHCTLVHLSGRDFERVMSDVPYVRISHRDN